MKNRLKVPIERILLIIIFPCVFYLVLFTMLKANFIKFYNDILENHMYIFDMVNNLTLAYIMSYIFFLVALIPERRKQVSINKYISIYLTHIIHCLNDIIEVSNSFKSMENKDLTNSPNITSVLRETGKVEFLTYKEHFVIFYNKFHKEYQHLSNYISFIDDELRDCLYQIITSEYLNRIHDFLLCVNSDEYHEVFTTHYDDGIINDLNRQLRHFANVKE